MATRKRKKTKAHPGVVLVKPSADARTGWRVRFKDPDTGKVVRRTIPAEDAATVDTRASYAQQLSQKLALRRAALGQGARRATGVTIEQAHDRFLDAMRDRAAKTQVTIRGALAVFIGWAAGRRLIECRDLSADALEDYRQFVVKRKQLSGQDYAPRSINRTLQWAVTWLRHVHRSGALPGLDPGTISFSLRSVRLPTGEPVFLNLEQCRALYAACRSYDAHNGTLIGRWVIALLLTGMRNGELSALEWRDIDLDRGEIRLRAATVKTRRSRTIDLSICPSLLADLKDMKAAAGDVEPTARVFPRVWHSQLRELIAHGAPQFTPHVLRRTCATVLSNSGVFGPASFLQSTKQLGHSLLVAERSYLGQIKGLPPDARTLEECMGIYCHGGALDGARGGR